MTVTIDKFGRVLIPKPLRDRLGLEPGTALDLDVRDSGDGAPTLELRPDLAETGLVQDGDVLVFRGRVDDAAADLVGLMRSERAARSVTLASSLLTPETPKS